MKINMTDSYQTRGGRPVRVLCVDKEGDDVYPVCALVQGTGSESLKVYTAGGYWERKSDPSKHDLVPAPRTHTYWVATYSTFGGVVAQCSLNTLGLAEEWADASGGFVTEHTVTLPESFSKSS